MLSKELERARAWEAQADIPPAERPLFHLTPTVGWLNDPNGFSVYKGAYHLFYQYNPYSVHWGPTHWGHCISNDLLRWERLPAALAPDTDYDRAGCFSGTAAEAPDGRQVLMYTGVRKEPLPDGSERELETQCVAIGDGVDYEKYLSNPVITGRNLPDGGSTWDFRDPKLWREGDVWYAAVANRTADGSGAILLYASPDLERWEYLRTLDRSENRWGRMWECPDLFQLDGETVLLVSPQELENPDRRFRKGHEVLCILGDWDGKEKRFTRKSIQPVDQGLDFYAPQTVLTPDGRRVLIAWMQAWGASELVPEGQRWFGQMTLPRELRVRDGKLLQVPVRELEAYRSAGRFWAAAPLEGRMELPGVSGRTLDLSLRLRPQKGEAFSRFTLELAKDERRATRLDYEPEQNRLTLDRSRSGFPAGAVDRRSVSVADRGGELELRVILDRYSVEVFVNGGEQVLSATLYTPQEAEGISFEVRGRALMDLEHHTLNTDDRRPF